MSREPPAGSGALRAFALAVIALLGLLAIVGSGGGVGFPPCEPPLCGPPPPPPPIATVTPAYVTAQVGTPVSWTVSAQNMSGSLSYQWMRRDAGAANYVEIPGATAASYGLSSVNLGDDGARFLVAVSSSGGFGAQAVAHLVVSATPGLLFADAEFLPSDWIVTPVAPPAPAQPPSVLTERVDSGGNPGAFRRMSFGLGSAAGSASAIYVWNGAAYDPATQGAVKVIDHAEDCGTVPPSDLVLTESALVIEQAGRHYVAYPSANCSAAPWSIGVGRASLAAGDFVLVDGPACGSGEACPDFSASGAPMRFGYRRIVFAAPGASVVHIIDNWRATVWR